MTDKYNYYFALFTGVLLGIMSAQNMGIYALFFILVVKIVSLFRLLPLSSNFLTILPVSFVVLVLISMLESLIFSRSVYIPKVIIESCLSLPVYFLIRLFEERFIVQNDLRLKFKN